jgi:uncharacterized membrane protein YoaK (UPF0700 family)
LGLLPFVLSVGAGSVDVIGFLWHGVFVAHITGKLILVAARVVAGTPTSRSPHRASLALSGPDWRAVSTRR